MVKGKFGAYCRNKCGMNVSRAMGAALTDSQIKSMLEEKKILVKGLKGKKGSYDAYLIPDGVKEYSYTKDGKEVQGFQYQLKLEFPQGKQTSRKNKGGVQAQKVLKWLWFICAGMRLSQEGFRMTLFSMAWA